MLEKDTPQTTTEKLQRFEHMNEAAFVGGGEDRIAKHNETLFKVANKTLTEYKLSMQASNVLNFEKCLGQSPSDFFSVQL